MQLSAILLQYPSPTLFMCSFLIVFLLGLQSKNVNGDHFIGAALTSTGIGLCNFYILKSIPNQNLDLLQALSYIAGGPVGILLSMFVHNRFLRKK